MTRLPEQTPGIKLLLSNLAEDELEWEDSEHYPGLGMRGSDPPREVPSRHVVLYHAINFVAGSVIMTKGSRTRIPGGCLARSSGVEVLEQTQEFKENIGLFSTHIAIRVDVPLKLPLGRMRDLCTKRALCLCCSCWVVTCYLTACHSTLLIVV